MYNAGVVPTSQLITMRRIYARTHDDKAIVNRAPVAGHSMRFQGLYVEEPLLGG
jgi:hypothetical protein